MQHLRQFWQSVIVGFAVYPILMIGFVLLIGLGTVARVLHLPTDSMPLIYGLVFAALTFALVELLGMASVVLGLISSANLIEYAQMVIPGRNASAVDFIAGLAGVILAAVLVWVTHGIVERSRQH